MKNNGMIGLIGNWVEVLRTCNLSPDRSMDVVSRWLLITRACVFSMTLLSALIGALLAGLAGAFDTLPFVLVVVGLILGHGSNNMVNDFFDVRHGVDTADYPRTKYAPHPILSNLVSIKRLILAIFICNLLDLTIAVILTVWKGWPIMLFAGAGLALSVLYVAPPFKLKHNGLGEVAIFAIWGPLMIGGTYYALSGTLPGAVIWASLPYGLAVMGVVMGKHLDKREKDAQKKVHTLPVLLGDRGGRILMGGLLIAFYAVIIILAILRVLPWFTLLTLLSLPRALRVLHTLTLPMPETPEAAFRIAADKIPKDLRKKFDPTKPDQSFPLWPLWYVVWGIWWVRHAGLFLVLSLGLSFLEPTVAKWLGQ